MSELKELIIKAKQKNVKAMEELFQQFTPLLKSRAKRYAQAGLEYEEVFQEASLLFIQAVYDYEERGNIPFAGYLKKRIDWGLWGYYRKYLKHKREVPSGLQPKNPEQ